MALGDAITRFQEPEDGMISTFRIGENCAYGRESFRISCQLYTASRMMRLADVTETEEIE